jgi:hypothetical protein
MVRQLVDDKIVDILWCKSADNVADFGTKNFSKALFREKSNKLNFNLSKGELGNHDTNRTNNKVRDSNSNNHSE